MQAPSRSDAATATIDGSSADGDAAPHADDELTTLRQAEAEAAAAETQAAEARARADQLRQQAKPGGERPTGGDIVDVSTDSPDEDLETAHDPPASTGRRLRRLRVSTIVRGVAVVASLVLLAASGYMVWFHQQVERDDQRRAQFTAAASQAVVTLMTIDSANAEGNVAQIIANSTGQFRDDFQSAADDFVKAAQDSKAATRATVRAAATESMTSDSAVVLVTAATTVSDAAGADQQPRNWRLSVTMLQDGTQIKLSKVEFVP